MREYYLCVSDQWFGPMSIQKIREFPVSKDMYIWWSGLSEWKKVGDLRDQEYLFQTVPPPVNKVDKKLDCLVTAKREIIRDIDDLVVTYQGLSSFVLYLSVALVLIVLFVVLGYSVVLLMRNPGDVCLFWCSLLGLFIFAGVLGGISLHLRAKSVVLRGNLGNFRLGNMSDVANINDYYGGKRLIEKPTSDKI